MHIKRARSRQGGGGTAAAVTEGRRRGRRAPGASAELHSSSLRRDVRPGSANAPPPIAFLCPTNDPPRCHSRVLRHPFPDYRFLTARSLTPGDVSHQRSLMPRLYNVITWDSGVTYRSTGTGTSRARPLVSLSGRAASR